MLVLWILPVTLFAASPDVRALVERGLAELLIHLEHQRLPAVARSGDTEGPEVGDLKRDVKVTQDHLPLFLPISCTVCSAFEPRR